MLSVPQGVVSAIALKPDRSISQATLRRALSPILGTKYKLLNREEQYPERTFLIKSEKIYGIPHHDLYTHLSGI